MNIENIPTSQIKPYERNTKKHSAKQVEQIAESIRQFGFRQPLVIDKDGVVVIGHGRLLAAKKLGMKEVPCDRAEGLTDEQIKALRLADNKTNESEWDIKLLAEDMGGIFDIDMSQFGFEVEITEDDEIAQEAKGSMKEKYLVPPFSVIYGNKPDWLARKRAWVEKGIRSELGRGGGLVFQLPEWMERQAPVKGAE